MDILLSLLLWINKVQVNHSSHTCTEDIDRMGEYKIGTRELIVCDTNATKKGISINEIIKHEFVHFLYDRDKRKNTYIPEPLFTNLIRKFMVSEETFYVITTYNEVDEELEARLISRFPTPVLFILNFL